MANFYDSLRVNIWPKSGFCWIEIIHSKILKDFIIAFWLRCWIIWYFSLKQGQILAQYALFVYLFVYDGRLYEQIN